jgi:hypothetical protein
MCVFAMGVQNRRWAATMSELYHEVLVDAVWKLLTRFQVRVNVVDYWKHLEAARERPRPSNLPTVGVSVTIVFASMRIVHHTLCLTEYHPYRIVNGDGEKVRNPKFDAMCGRLLDIKGDPNAKNFKASVLVYADLLAKALKDYPLAPFVSVDIAIIPKSEAGRVSPGLVAVAERLVALDKRFVLPRPQILTREKTIEKLANGGNRAAWVHTTSISAEIPPERKGRAVLLLDDIGTTGNSLMACTDLLYLAGAGRVIPVVLGRTV